MTGDLSRYERLLAAVAKVQEEAEWFGCEVYQAVESEQLKRVAVAVGVDYTREPTVVLDDILHAYQRVSDVNRELRRHIAALESRDAGSGGVA